MCAFDNNEDAIFRLKLKYEQSEFQDNIRYFYGDVRDRDRLIQAMSGVAEVYHCAALKHVELCEYNPFETIKTNVEGTQNLIEAARYARVKKVLLASSDKAVNPTSIMGTTKLCCEKLIVAANDMYHADGISFVCKIW